MWVLMFSFLSLLLSFSLSRFLGRLLAMSFLWGLVLSSGQKSASKKHLLCSFFSSLFSSSTLPLSPPHHHLIFLYIPSYLHVFPHLLYPFPSPPLPLPLHLHLTFLFSLYPPVFPFSSFTSFSLSLPRPSSLPASKYFPLRCTGSVNSVM